MASRKSKRTVRSVEREARAAAIQRAEEPEAIAPDDDETVWRLAPTTVLPSDPDGVIEATCDAIASHADDLRAPLFAFVDAPEPRTAIALRLGLVMLASGVERGCHDGATFPARVAAARRALEAWG